MAEEDAKTIEERAFEIARGLLADAVANQNKPAVEKPTVGEKFPTDVQVNTPISYPPADKIKDGLVAAAGFEEVKPVANPAAPAPVAITPPEPPVIITSPAPSPAAPKSDFPTNIYPEKPSVGALPTEAEKNPKFPTTVDYNPHIIAMPVDVKTPTLTAPAEAKPTPRVEIGNDGENPMLKILEGKKDSAPDVRGAMGIPEAVVGSEFTRVITPPPEVSPQVIVITDDAKKAIVIASASQADAMKEFKEHAQGHAGFGNRDAGTLVALAQTYMNSNADKDHQLKVDGVLGDKTEKAIKELQKELGFKKEDQDGILGEKTWVALREAMKDKDGHRPSVDDLKKDLQDNHPKAAAQANAYDAARDGLKHKAHGGHHTDHTHDKVPSQTGHAKPQHEEAAGRK